MSNEISCSSMDPDKILLNHYGESGVEFRVASYNWQVTLTILPSKFSGSRLITHITLILKSNYTHSTD